VLKATGLRLGWRCLAWGVVVLWAGVERVAKAENDPAAVVYWVQPRDVVSKEVTEAQDERKKTARADLDLETSMREKGYFWVNGGWVKKGEPVSPARSVGDLKDSDGDGFDDFTEIKFHTDPLKPESTPASYFQAKGSNKVTFYGTNATAHGK
jgi:Bacterial TSP3 repeat